MDNKPTTVPLATVAELTMEEKVDLMWAAFTKGTPLPVAAPANRIFQEGDRVVWRSPHTGEWQFGLFAWAERAVALVISVHHARKAKDYHYGGQYIILVPDFAHHLVKIKVDTLKLELYNPQGEYKVGQ